MKSLNNIPGDLIVYLHKKNVLRQLIRSDIIAHHLSNISIEESIAKATKDTYRKRLNLTDEISFQNWLKDNALSNDDFEQLALSSIRLKKFCLENFEHKIEAHFLERKDDLDNV